MKANRSFLDKRAGTISRSRSKSIGGGARTGSSRPRSRSGERTPAFEALASRTLLGGQIRPPTITVHAPPRSSGSHSRSQSHSYSQTNTRTQTATAQTATFNSSGYQGTRPSSRRTRSHAHSNSLGQTTVTSSSKESRTPSHTRSQSLGKAAFRMVAATGVAAFCGLTGRTGEKGPMSPNSEKAEALEGALQMSGTKHIHLRDQLRAEEVKLNGDKLAVAASPSAMLDMISRSNGVSPTPSGLSSSGEGVGIAITSASIDNLTNRQGREPIRFPGHPYALNTAYVSASSHPIQASTSTETRQGVTEATATPHRQPVLLHPYSQSTHPYASASHQQNRPTNIRPPPPHLALYAELTPDHVRQFAPEALRYSPDIPTPVVVKPSADRQPSTSHPYGGPDSKRTSELGIGEALIHTLRRGSIDSGIGTSEAENFDAGQSWGVRPYRPDSAMDEIIRIHEVAPDNAVSPGSRPSPAHASSGGGLSIVNTTASSPPANVNPPLFREQGLSASNASLGTQHGGSSGSSPGAISHDSSPPLSPRIINTSDDLERFRDLFYKPVRQNSGHEEVQRPAMGSRQASGSIILDVGSQRSTRSGLSTLARQLSEELEEMRHEYGSPDFDDDRQLSWGRQHGGLHSPPLDEMDESPNMVLAQFSGSPEDGGMMESPMRMPIDITFVSPPSNIPEDIESSRASSDLEISPLNDDEADRESSSDSLCAVLNFIFVEHFRLGEVEAVSTPRILTTPARFSAQLSLVGHDSSEDNTLRVDVTEGYRPSNRTNRLSPLSPHTPNTRSSYRTSGTDMSRMSGLSDFPVPPTLLPISSRLQYVHNQDSDRPRLERESSYATFGRADDDYSIGQAI